ncbi:MAG: glycosyltransferase family 4 protein [Caldilineaceae bacterium]|nr:glycosyltransferase family 4 protein [Caldilineaceae bacterium]
MAASRGKLAHLASAGHDRVNPEAMSLRIVFVAPFGLKQKTTVWARTLPMAQALVAAGHSATILIPPWDSPEDAGKTETIGGVRMQQLPLGGGLLATVRRMVQAVDQAMPHIVHIVKPRAHAGLVQWWLWQRRPYRQQAAPRILLDVDDWEQAWNPVNRYHWFVGQFLRRQEEWGIRHADGITAASRWLEQKVATVAPHIPTLYLPNGVNPLSAPQFNRSATPDRPPQVLFFTRFIEVSPDWLKTFWAELHSQMPSAQLVIAGTPVQPWLAAPFQTALAGEPQITWTGYVPSNELGDLYARATCAIFPATPIPLLEAKCSVRLATTLLHGVPVIASAVGEQSSYGADGAAQLVPARATPVEFARAVVEVLQNPAQHAALRAHATDRLLTRYAWSHLTAQLLDFYTTLLDQPRASTTLRQR